MIIRRRRALDEVPAQVELERRYRRWLAWYPRQDRAELLGIVMQSAQDGQARPGLPDTIDLIRGAARSRLRRFVSAPPRQDAWRRALADFTVLAPAFLLISNLTVDAYLVLYRLLWHPFPPQAHQVPGHLGVVIALSLVVAGQLPLALALLLRWRHTAGVALFATAVYWVFWYGGGLRFGAPTTMFYLGFCLLEAAGLLAGSRNPARRPSGLGLAGLGPAAVLAGLFWLHELAYPDREFGLIILVLLVTMAIGMLVAGQRSRYLACLFAVALYPSAVDVGIPAGRVAEVAGSLPGWALASYLLPVAAMLLAAKANFRARGRT